MIARKSSTHNQNSYQSTQTLTNYSLELSTHCLPIVYPFEPSSTSSTSIHINSLILNSTSIILTLVWYNHLLNSSHKQIQSQRKDKPQRLAGTSQLILLQYLLYYKSSTNDCNNNSISFNTIQIAFLDTIIPSILAWNTNCSSYKRESSFDFSKDSDLEAFSHNPTDDSFPSLTCQLNGFTNYLN